MTYYRKMIHFQNACRILSGWKNQYRNRNNHFTEANDGIEFMIVDGEEKKLGKKKSNVLYYLNECDKEAMVPVSW